MNIDNKYNPNCFIGYSADNDVRYRASSGGITTAVINYLFDIDYIQTCLSFEFDLFSCRYVPKLIYKYDDYNLCGSIYQDVNLNEYIKNNIDNIKGRMLVTCTPCLVKPIRNVLQQAGIESFFISFVCSGMTSVEGTYKYYQMLGLNRKDIAGIRYRGNGWPNGIEITLNNGEVIKHPNYTEPWKTMHSSHFWQPKKCFFCQQVFSKDADLAVADPWLKQYMETDKIGHTIMAINTLQGKKIIEELNALSKVKISTIDYEQFYKSQEGCFMSKGDVIHRKKLLTAEYKLVSNSLYRSIFSRSISSIRIHKYILRLQNRIIRLITSANDK